MKLCHHEFIPHVCHIFYTTEFLGLEVSLPKLHNLQHYKVSLWCFFVVNQFFCVFTSWRNFTLTPFVKNISYAWIVQKHFYSTPAWLCKLWNLGDRMNLMAVTRQLLSNWNNLHRHGTLLSQNCRPKSISHLTCPFSQKAFFVCLTCSWLIFLLLSFRLNRFSPIIYSPVNHASRNILVITGT